MLAAILLSARCLRSPRPSENEWKSGSSEARAYFAALALPLPVRPELRQAHLDDARRMHAEGFGWDVISRVTGINREDLNLEQ